MSWLDTLRDRGLQAKREAEPAPSTPTVRRKAPIELRSVIVQTSYAHPDRGDPGAVEVGYYSVADGVLTMRDERGKALGKGQTLGPNDDPHVIAGRFVRAKWRASMGEGNFNRRLSHRPLRLA